MRIIKGQHNFAKVMIDDIEQSTEDQIKTFLDCPVFKGSRIAIMPDCHAGEGAVIGFTATMNDYVIPNVVGVDIACGVEAYNIGKVDIDFQKFDDFIRKNIPHGMNVNSDELYNKKLNHIIYSKDSEDRFFEILYGKIKPICKRVSSKEDFFNRVKLSLGSLGSGNHFCELNMDSNGNIWFCIHTGSRNLGKVVAEYHQDKAKKQLEKFFINDQYKKLEFLPMDLGGKEYLEDMKSVQQYAMLNRELIARTILCGYFGFDREKFHEIESIKTMHNYINFEDNIIRKGAISAHAGERVLIPINMRDGVIVGKGKGNQEWNYSAPHGAGRILGRNQARKDLSLDEYKETMKDVWSSCVSESTIDEAPMAYKSIDLIMNSITPTVDVEFVMKPVYNFKSDETRKK